MTRLLPLVALVIGCIPVAGAQGADWPQYRYDAGRRAASEESLPENLHRLWVRELPPPRPAFPTEVRLRYDASYEPVVLKKTMFVPSMVTDSLTALNTEDGEERWRFFAEGPVRLAPVAWQDKVYFVSDDGYLYCVDAVDGKLLWKFRGRPDGGKHRKAMGNGRLVSLVPARGGPVLADGVIYFAAGIWSGEGVFVHALDATSGKTVWSNVEVHQIEKANMDHGIAHYAGLSPQGHMAIVDGKLVIPCGSQLPALLDPKTGKVDTYTMGWGGRVGLPKGCSFVSGVGQYLFHGGDLYDIRRPNEEKFRDPRGREDFKSMLYPAGLTRLQIDRVNQKGLGQFREPVLTQDAIYFQQGDAVISSRIEPTLEERVESEVPTYRANDQYPDQMKATFPELWRVPSKSKVHIKAAARLYCGRRGIVEAVDIPAQGEEPKISWQAELEGTPHRMLAADGKLFVVTREGSIYAFGPRKPAETVVHALPSPAAPKSDRWTKKAADILEKTATGNGYVVMFGIGSGRLAEEIVRQSQCDVIAVDPDSDKVARLRGAFQRAGLYGTRITVYVGDPASYPLPPYLASLIVSEDPAYLGDALDAASTERLFRSLRPYGGTACLVIGAARREAFIKEVRDRKLRVAVALPAGDLVLLTRKGALPGAANWSHRGANAANTGASRDRFLKAPLGRLWFDGSFRWMRTKGTSMVRVAGGRVLVKSAKIDAIDVYTGRHLWSAALPDSHGRSGEMVAVEDAIYLPGGRSCVVLDPATGKKSGQLDLPDDVQGNWGRIRVAGDYLVGAVGKTLVCMDRHAGRMLWKHQRERVLGSIALGGGKVFAADFVDKRREAPKPDKATIKAQAFDASTGKLLWEITGVTDVRYSEPLDLVATSGGVYRAHDGTRVWQLAGSWPITDDKLLSGNNKAFVTYDLSTGTKSGEKLAWVLRGCTVLRAGSTMLTTRFRGNAAYVDLATGEISSIWNVRAACSNNLFPANGVLNVPNLSGGCTCNYMPISQALVPLSSFE